MDLQSQGTRMQDIFGFQSQDIDKVNMLFWSELFATKGHIPNQEQGNWLLTKSGDKINILGNLEPKEKHDPQFNTGKIKVDLFFFFWVMTQ